MKQIPDKYVYLGMERTLVMRQGYVVVYKCEYNPPCNQYHYEVMKVRYHPKDLVLGGKTVAYEGDEFLPSSSEWGLWGWTYNSKEAAIQKFKEL